MNGALIAFKRNKTEYPNFSYRQQFIQNGLQLSVTNPYNQSSIYNFEQENCSAENLRIGEEFCSCLKEEHYDRFVVNFGQKLFKPIEILTEENKEEAVKVFEATGQTLIFDEVEKQKKDQMRQILMGEKPKPTTGPATRVKREIKFNTQALEDVKKSLGDNIGDFIDKTSENWNHLAEKNSQFFETFAGGVNTQADLYKQFIGSKIAKAQSQDTMRLVLHQTLLFVLVIGRWILPKGKITDSELSQLLLVFIGVAADIIEFITETIDEDSPDTFCNTNVHYAIWLVWTWSLSQFVMQLTASKGRKIRLGFEEDGNDHTGRGSKVSKSKKSASNCCGLLYNSDLWGMLITLIFQDGPFLLARLYLLIFERMLFDAEGHLNQMLLFFTCKNILIILLQIYRFCIVWCDENHDGNIDSNDIELKILKQAMKKAVTDKGDIDPKYMEIKPNQVNGTVTVVMASSKKSLRAATRSGSRVGKQPNWKSATRAAGAAAAFQAVGQQEDNNLLSLE